MATGSPRIAHQSSSEKCVTSRPAMRIRPASMREILAGVRPSAARASVDFPEPDSPTSPTASPAPTNRLTPSSARTVRPRVV